MKERGTTVHCSHCGAQLADGAKFCVNCGAAVEDSGAAASASNPAPVVEPTAQAAATPTPAQPNGGLSTAARIVIIVAIVAVVAIVAGFIGCNAGRVIDSQPSSSSASSSAGGSSAASSASSSSSSSSSSASPVAMTPSPSGKLVEYKAQNGGFGITIDDTFTVKDTADQFIVYTAKEGVLPQYQIIWSRTPASGMTDEEILDNMVNIAVKNYGDSLITGPVTNSFQLSDGRTVRGIEYIYKTDSGGHLAKYEYYDNQVNGFTYTWSGTCNPDDNITTRAMEVAMDSFHFLAG